MSKIEEIMRSLREDAAARRKERIPVTDTEQAMMRLIWQHEGKLKCKTCQRKGECAYEAQSTCINHDRKYYRASSERFSRTLGLVRNLQAVMNLHNKQMKGGVL